MIALPMFAAMITFAAHTGRTADPTPARTRRTARAAAHAALTAATVASAVGGLVDLVGAATAPILIVVGLVAAPCTWARARGPVDRLIGRIVAGQPLSSDARHRRYDP